MELRGYRWEPLVLALIAVAALSPVNVSNPQDGTRYELTRSVVLHHRLTIPSDLFDRAVYHGRTYSDKAPGMSFLAVPAYQLERLLGIARQPKAWEREGDLSLWLMHVLTSGVAFLVAAFLVGRAAEGIAAGTGAATAAAFGVASPAASLAPTLFEHDAAGALAFAGFILATRARRQLFAGLSAGAAVLFQYAAALVLLTVGVYAAFRNRRRVVWFGVGAAPPLVLLGLYDWAAFGSPFHLSYKYVANRFAEQQHHGFFGIGIPTLGGLREVLVGNLGLLVTSPVVLAAGAGLWLLWRRGARAEAAVAAFVSVAFVLLNAAYFLPYGGNSPGPRFLACALPFLFLGLPLALRRWPWPTLALLAYSAVVTTVNSATWALRPPEDNAWLPSRTELATAPLAWIGVNRNYAALIMLLCALGSVAIGALSVVRRASRPA